MQNAGAQLLDETQGARVHLEFMPNDAPDPDAQVSIPPEQITTELLKLCEEFLREAGPIVHTELRQFLTERGHHGGLGWFLDALSFTTFNRTPAAGPALPKTRRPGR